MDKTNVPLESLLDASNHSVYGLVILAAKRAIQISDGENPLLEKASDKALDSALREIENGKIIVRKKK
ncbi:MAG: DNA-directed RNA polymerase subunit omega [Candidatus Omnitrophica bacterium]|nr:DNA-directed RNA polymerase subunit omega [Candidatus Omnitrophota bacterium]